MIAKRLKSGQAAYYWNAKKSDIKSGFSLHREALGVDYASAKLRADQLNAHLDAWRVGKGADRSLERPIGSAQSIGGSKFTVGRRPSKSSKSAPSRATATSSVY